MFYSHEVLTSRKYGVATIWLVATLGSKCGLKKVNRKAIFDVDVPKACGSIMQPDAPMALRLQSNLLYGVSKVYSQQCHYILVDAQNAYHSLKQMLRGIKVTDLAGDSTARPDLLQLSDDPAFTPGLAYLPIDFNVMEVHLHTSQPRTPSLNSISSQLTIHSLGQGSQALPGLIIPPESSDGGADVGFHFDGDDSPGSARPAEPSSAQRQAVELLDAGFNFDEDGNMVDTEIPNEPLHAQQAGLGAELVGGTAAVQGNEADQQDDDQLLGLMDVDLPLLGEDAQLPDAEPLSPAAPAEPNGNTSPAAQAAEDRSQVVSSQADFEGQSSSPSTAQAPMRRKARGRRPIRPDRRSMLGNTELRNWNQNYLQNMAKAKRSIAPQKLAAIGRKNAEWMVLGRGIADVGYGIGSHGVKSPFDMFCGDSLWEMITGKKRNGEAVRKRSLDLDDGDDSNDSEGRRVRPRSKDNEVRRATEDDNDEADALLPPLADDDDIEMPREPVPGLEDPSAMPWNITASIRGSSVTHGRSASQPAVLASARSRVVSASPLERGSTAAQAAGAHDLPSSDHDDFGGDGFPSNHDNDEASIPPPDFRRLGLPDDDTHPTASQRIRAALDKEGHNFLGFIEHGIAEQRRRIEDEGGAAEDDGEEVLFETLLPPEENTRMVAAQAFMHVLALATKNLIAVRQEGYYAEIGMRLVEGAE